MGLVGLHGEPAEAHTGARAFILILPTHRFQIGGAVVVALSFVVAIFIPTRRARMVERTVRGFGWPVSPEPFLPSLIVLIVLISLVVAGLLGSRDPLANPLPLAVWTLWWVGLAMLQVVVGDVWSQIQPWRAGFRLVTSFPGLRRARQVAPLPYPEWLGTGRRWACSSASLGSSSYTPLPKIRPRLAVVVLGYAVITLAGMVLFGERIWIRHGDAFSVFFRVVGWLAPVRYRAYRLDDDARQTQRAALRLPCAGLLEVGALPPSAIAFVLLALASVSFDGLSRTFWWLDLIGENPLEFSGRSAVIVFNTLGLAAAFATLGAVYLVALGAGKALAREPGQLPTGSFALAIVPIAFGYHFAHYLPEFLVDVQWAVKALSDPFALGWNLLGTRDLHVTASILTYHGSVQLIWGIQVLGIVVAHVLAVAVGHLLAIQHLKVGGDAVRSQIPATVLMVVYTGFGLWLLSTPVAA